MSRFQGCLELEASLREDGQTCISRQFHQGAFHLSKSYWDGHVLRVQVTNPTAGMLEGDELSQTIQVHAGASLLVSTPAQSRAFCTRNGSVTCQQKLMVDERGWLDYFPEALVPHANCHYAQRTTINVARGASLFYCDAFAPGRTGRGEAWQWRHLEIGLDVFLDGTHVLRELLHLDAPQAARMAANMGMDAPWFASMVWMHHEESILEQAAIAVRELHQPPHLWLGASKLPHGRWWCRIIAKDGLRLRDAITQVRECLNAHFPRLPVRLRKY